MLNERLKKLRKKHNVTQRFLAEIMGVKEVSWQRFEYGTSKPKLENLIAIADYFNVSLDYLVGRTDKEEINK